jgi:hypothetical protein
MKSVQKRDSLEQFLSRKKDMRHREAHLQVMTSYEAQGSFTQVKLVDRRAASFQVDLYFC